MVVCLLAAAFVFCLLAAAFVFSFLDPLVEFYCILARLIESDPKPLSVCLALVYPRASSSCRLNVVLSMLASCCCCRVGVLWGILPSLHSGLNFAVVRRTALHRQ